MGDWLGSDPWWIVAEIGIGWVLFDALILVIMRAGALSDRRTERAVLQVLPPHTVRGPCGRSVAGTRPATHCAGVRGRPRASSRS
jgi:hypothetical protein